MFTKFLWLEWKSFFRSASLGKSLGLKILMAFLALYFSAMFLLLGVALFPMLKKLYPDVEPLRAINGFALTYFCFEFILRFLLQSLPVLEIKPLLNLPVLKRKVVNFVLVKSLYSFYNFIPLFIFVPFAVYSLIHGYPVWQILGWLITILSISLSVNFFNFIVKKRFTDNIKAFLPIVGVIGVFAILEYFDIFHLTSYFGEVLNRVYENPVFVLFPLILLGLLFKWNQKNLESKFYLDANLSAKQKEAKIREFGWTKKFGSIAPFLQLDLKLIWRNKRPKTIVYLAFIFLVYGLIFYPNETYQSMKTFFVFVGIFITGIFIINFGQFIPSWDSSYYQMIMAQNIPMKQYLSSKMGLMSVSVIVLLILSTPYVYFGWDILFLNIACALYNMGVNIPMLIFAGSFNKKRIDLDQSPFMNYQGMGASQWLVAFPLLLLPISIFWLTNRFISYEVAIGTLGIIGLIGLGLRPVLLNFLTSRYRKRKYVMIEGFKQKGD